jgi:diketogulonate reductase-like aldo/keto reductase
VVRKSIYKDAVDTSKVPHKTLNGGDRIPAIGLGTFGSDSVPGETVAEAVKDAVLLGYRHIDCASVYGNERYIGKALEEAMAEGIKREDLWITSKVWNDMHGEGDVLRSALKSIKDLRLEYLDLYLIHWPFPNYHAPGVGVGSRDPHAGPYIHENYMRTWRQMEDLIKRGLVRHIGSSNMTIAKLSLLLRDCAVKPACNQMELHPHFQQPELFRYVIEKGILPIGYSPLGSPGRPHRDRAMDDTVDMEDPVILDIAERTGLHPAAVCLKWAVQRGQIPIPFSVKRSNYLSNLRAVTGDTLSDEDMKLISGIDRKCRLIKGQVFLWPGARGWEDLWDNEGG